MSRRIGLGDVFSGPSGLRWTVVRRTEDNLSKGVFVVMFTLRAKGSHREIQRSELRLTQSVDAGIWRQLPRGGDTLLEILEPDLLQSCPDESTCSTKTMQPDQR
jgi:hypothetical protein